jgi:nicotinamidase-related amidase
MKGGKAMTRTIQIADRGAFKEGLKRYLTIDPRKTVVLTVDMQRQYIDQEVAGKPLLPDESERIMKYSKELLSFARKQGIPVVHVYVCRRRTEVRDIMQIGAFAQASKDLKLSQNPDVADRVSLDRIEGTLQSQVPAQLVADGDLHVTSKRTMDGYFGTELDYLLSRVFKPEVVVLTGINTDTCVYATTFATSNRGYKPVVISDCVASSRGKDCHEMALELMSRGFAWVLTVAEFKKKVLSES